LYVCVYVRTYVHTYTHTHISANSYISCSNDEPGVEHQRGVKIYTFLMLTDTLVTAIEMTYEYISVVMNGMQIIFSSLLKCVSINLFINFNLFSCKYLTTLVKLRSYANIFRAKKIYFTRVTFKYHE